MNTNGRFPKCLFKSFSEVFVASFCFTYRYCYLKLPVVAKKDKTRMTYPISVCVCVFFFFSVSTCFSFGLVSGLPGNHDGACLLHSCFQVQPRYWFLAMSTSSAGYWSILGVCLYSPFSYQHAIWISLIDQGLSVLALC